MEEKEALKCRVVFVGESGVGKYDIIHKYLSNTFISSSNNTLGANFVVKNEYFKDYEQTISFEIWDTAGQERYRALSKIFFQNSNVCILVYDITKSSSFKALKNYWIKEIIDNASANLSN